MDTASVSRRNLGASDLLLEHCFALDTSSVAGEVRGPTGVDRLEALLGAEMARRLLLALSAKS